MASSAPADYLPPAVEAALFDDQLYRYMIIVPVVVYTYDWLLSVSEEVEIVSQRRLSWPIAIYFLSRVSECAHVFLIAMTSLAPMENCVAIFVASGVCCTMSIATTSYLFLLRVQAVYRHSRPITVVFGCFWIVTIGLNILSSATAGTHVEHVAGTQFCTSTDSKYFALPCVSSFVNDTLIFLAISYRLAANAPTEHNWRSWILSITKGKGLYRLSKSLMKNGLAYYAAIILFFFANLATMYSPLVPVLLHYSLVNTYIAFTNLMACKLFRGIALGMMQDNPSSWNTARISAALESHAPHRLVDRQGWW